MKTKIMIALLGLFAVSCGIMGSGDGIAVTYKDGSSTVDPKSTALLVSTVSDSSTRKEMVSHTFVIANYELPEKLTKMKLQRTAKEDGNMRAEFTIIGAKGTGKDTPIKTGEYEARVGNVGSAENSANGGRILVAKDGKETSTYVGGPDMKAGKIKIDSVSEDTVTGEVDLTDGTNSIKGKFTVKTK